MGMMWLRKNWGIISGVTVAVCFIVGAIVNHFTVETQLLHNEKSAEKARESLVEEDKKLNQRVSRNEISIESQGKSLVRMETQQTAIQKGTARMNKKIDKLDSKIDRLLMR